MLVSRVIEIDWPGWLHRPMDLEIDRSIESPRHPSQCDVGWCEHSSRRGPEGGAGERFGTVRRRGNSFDERSIIVGSIDRQKAWQNAVNPFHSTAQTTGYMEPRAADRDPGAWVDRAAAGACGMRPDRDQGGQYNTPKTAMLRVDRSMPRGAGGGHCGFHPLAWLNPAVLHGVRRPCVWGGSLHRAVVGRPTFDRSSA